MCLLLIFVVLAVVCVFAIMRIIELEAEDRVLPATYNSFSVSQDAIQFRDLTSLPIVSRNGKYYVVTETFLDRNPPTVRMHRLDMNHQEYQNAFEEDISLVAGKNPFIRTE